VIVRLLRAPIDISPLELATGNPNPAPNHFNAEFPLPDCNSAELPWFGKNWIGRAVEFGSSAHRPHLRHRRVDLGTLLRIRDYNFRKEYRAQKKK
jgi:hypothetical protein